MSDPPAIEIREYTPDDYDACRSLWAELTQHHRDIYDAPTIGGDDPGGGFDEYLANGKRAISWVATVNGSVAGLTGLLIEASESEIEPVVVTKGYRSKGVGAQLVQTAIDESRARGLVSVSVRPVARNSDALQFFHAAGFNTLGHVELYMPLSDGERTWVSGVKLAGRDFAT